MSRRLFSAVMPDAQNSPDPNFESSSERPKTSWFWIKDSAGYPSVSITMLSISFVVTTMAYILSIVHKIGPFEFGTFDVAACGSYFGVILAAYCTRRYTDAKFNASANGLSSPPSMPPGIGLGKR